MLPFLNTTWETKASISILYLSSGYLAEDISWHSPLKAGEKKLPIQTCQTMNKTHWYCSKHGHHNQPLLLQLHKTVSLMHGVPFCTLLNFTGLFCHLEEGHNPGLAMLYFALALLQIMLSCAALQISTVYYTKLYSTILKSYFTVLY